MLESSRGKEETRPFWLVCCSRQCQASSAAGFSEQTASIFSEAASPHPSETLSPVSQSPPAPPRLNPSPLGTNSSQRSTSSVAWIPPPLASFLSFQVLVTPSCSLCSPSPGGNSSFLKFHLYVTSVSSLHFCSLCCSPTLCQPILCMTFSLLKLLVCFLFS